MLMMARPCKSIVVSAISVPSMNSHTYYYDDEMVIFVILIWRMVIYRY